MAGTTLLDILGLTDPAAALIAASTGGTIAPPGVGALPGVGEAQPPAAAGNGTGGAAAGASGMPRGAVEAVLGLKRQGALKKLSPAQMKVLGRALEERGQTRTVGVRKGRLGAVLENFGGQVIGSMNNEAGDVGHEGRGAVVLRDGKLWHVYDDGTKMKIQEGAVARALGIGGNVTGGAQAPGRLASGRPDLARPGRGGGAVAPITFRRQQPGPHPGQQMEGHYSRGPGYDGPTLSEDHRVPDDPLTGGALAPEADGTSQAAVATESDVPMTAAEAYRRRLMAAHARLGL